VSDRLKAQAGALAGWATLQCAKHSWLLCLEARDRLRREIDAAWARGDHAAHTTLFLAWLEAATRARLMAGWLDRLLGDEDDG
jgi:hypothetical protein